MTFEEEENLKKTAGNKGCIKCWIHGAYHSFSARSGRVSVDRYSARSPALYTPPTVGVN